MKEFIRLMGSAALSFVAIETMAVSSSDYARHFQITVDAQDAALKGATATGLVIPVRLSESTIGNFKYADFQTEGLKDLLFVDADGTALPHEIDTLNKTGETLVWVRTSSLKSGDKIDVYYDGPDAGVTASDTWQGYTGIWHLNALDATASDYGSYPNSSSLGTEADGQKASISTAGSTGVFGSSVYVNSTTAKGTNCTKGGVFVPHSDALGIGSTFTISGWFKHKDQSYYYDHMFAKANSGANGFRAKVVNGWTTAGQVQVIGNSSTTTTAWPDTMTANWALCTFVFDGSSYKVYQNGALVTELTSAKAITDTTEMLAFGNLPSAAGDATGDCAWCGWIDEVRLAGGVARTADEIAQEYAFGSDATLMTYSDVADVSTVIALQVANSPDGIGSPMPACGTIALSEAPSFLTSGTNFTENGIWYTCSKFTTEKSSDGGISWSAPVEHTGADMTYTYDGVITRVTWIWEAAGYTVTVSTPHEGASVEIGSDPAYVDANGMKYYAKGRSLTVTASDARATSLREWRGATADMVKDGYSLTFQPSAPVTLEAILRHPWTYGNKVLTDGEWSLSATLSGSEISVTGCTTAAPSGVIDFTSGVSDASGNTLTVVAVESKAFMGNTSVRAVSVGEGFRKLNWYAFQNCTNLESFTPFLPSTVTSCGGGVFDGCSKLVGDLTVAGCSTLPNKAFAGTAITSVNLSGVEDMIGGSEFDYCTSLTNAILEAAVKIGSRIFRGCTSLQSVTLGERLAFLGYSAFDGCTQLTTVSPLLPESLTTLDTSVYNGTLNNGAFNGCTSLTGDVRLVNASLKDVYGQIFQNTRITSLYAPFATNLWKFAMYGCAALTNVTFGADSVINKGYYPISGNPTSLAVYFPGKAPVLDASVGERSFGSQKYIRVYCDPKMDPDGWAALMNSSSFSSLTDTDCNRSEYPGDKTLGCLVEKNGIRYYLVSYRSPLRKPGLSIIIR